MRLRKYSEITTFQKKMEDFRFVIKCNDFNKKKKIQHKLALNILKEIKKLDEIQQTLTTIQDHSSKRGNTGNTVIHPIMCVRICLNTYECDQFTA